MVQKLMLAESVYDELQDGVKSVTIRKGRRDISLGQLNFESVENERVTTVNVKKVIYCKLGGVPEEYIHADGFTSAQHMLEVLSEFYPGITLNDEVTIVEFTKY